MGGGPVAEQFARPRRRDVRGVPAAMARCGAGQASVVREESSRLVWRGDQVIHFDAQYICDAIARAVHDWVACRPAATAANGMLDSGLATF